MLFLFVANSSTAQEQIIFDSEFVPQPDTTWIFTPTTYSDDRSYPLVYLLHGYSEDYKQWNRIIDLQQLADEHRFIIVTPNGFKSWYLNSPTDPHSQFERFFFRELVPTIHKRFAIEDENIFISGLSMGGYGALRLFIKRPDYFSTAGSTSGGVAFNVKEFRRASLFFFENRRMIEDHITLLGNNDQAFWDKFSIATLLKKNRETLQNKPFIFDIGTDDPLYAMNRRLKKVSENLGLPVTFITQPGNHTDQYWNISIQQHMAFFHRHLE